MERAQILTPAGWHLWCPVWLFCIVRYVILYLSCGSSATTMQPSVEKNHNNLACQLERFTAMSCLRARERAANKMCCRGPGLAHVNNHETLFLPERVPVAVSGAPCKMK